MSKINVSPYLFFRGEAEEAMEFYHAIFGGTLEKVAYSQENGVAPPEGFEGKLMHSYLENEYISLMASDTPEASEKSAKIAISLSGYSEDEEVLMKAFHSLSEGVEVKYPLKKESWGDMFGSVTDKYGVEWMVNISPGQNPA